MDHIYHIEYSSVICPNIYRHISICASLRLDQRHLMLIILQKRYLRDHEEPADLALLYFSIFRIAELLVYDIIRIFLNYRFSNRFLFGFNLYLTLLGFFLLVFFSSNSKTTADAFPYTHWYS